MISFAAMVPHPPIIIPEIGKDEIKKVKKTVSALSVLNMRLKDIAPDTIIIISPHGFIFQNKMTLMKSDNFKGSLFEFGSALSFKLAGDTELASRIEETSKEENIALEVIDQNSPYQKGLDHGIMVPFYHLLKGVENAKILPIFYSLLSRESHLKFGELISGVIEKNFKDKKIAIIASGDLSHRLMPNSPAGFTPQAKMFDSAFIRLLKAGNLKGIINMDPSIVEEAGECGYKSFLILAGALESLKYDTKVLSYEAPLGVGYVVCDFIV